MNWSRLVSLRAFISLTVVLSSQGCIYRPLIDFGAPFKASEAHSNNQEMAPAARARFFMPAVPRPRLPAPSLEVTPEVEREIRIYRKGRFVSQALGRRAPYLHIMREILVDEGVPSDILNLAIIESGFKADIKSPAGAAGLWQLMKSTARTYGLKVDFFRDQRNDPILSTIAALRHLKDLYSVYKDWYLALAAYNAGPATIDRAMKRARTRDFWKLARSGYLRHETIRFVPRFIAVSILVREHDGLSGNVR